MESSYELMKIRYQIIGGFVVIAVMAMVMATYLLRQLQGVSGKIKTDISNELQQLSRASRLHDYADQIVYYDEVLTQSARNYVFTGDVKWRERYEAAEPILDSVIKKAIEEGDEADKNIFIGIDGANKDLVMIEHLALDEVAAGRRKEAAAMLEGDVYMKQKVIYKQGIDKYLSQKGIRYGKYLDATVNTGQVLSEESAKGYSDASVTVLLITLAMVAGAFLAGSLLIRDISSPITKLEEYVHNIQIGNFTAKMDERTLKSKNEVGDFARAFEEMTKSLINYKLALEGRVELQSNQLSQEKNKAEVILDSIADGLLVTDELGNVIKINSKALNLLGFQESEIIGNQLTKMVRLLDDRENVVSMNDRPVVVALKSNSSVARRLYYGRKDGVLVPVQVTVSPVSFEGKIIGTIEIFRDISKEKEVEKLKDEFVSLASHELRTPMTAVKGFVSMMLEGDFGPIQEKMREPIEAIGMSTDRLITLVNDMLDVTRIESGRIKIESSNFEIRPVVLEAVSGLQPIAKQKNILLNVGEVPEVWVTADVNKIKQVLTNLIGNSLKFTDKGGINVSGRIDGNFLKMFIEDTGMGIVTENQVKLFVKFKQIHSQQEGKPVGTGLGLYLSRELVRKMGGDLWIERSAAGQGSVFGFSITIANTDKLTTIESTDG